MKRNTAGLKEKLIETRIEEIRIKGIASSLNARNQQVLMGCNFVRFAQRETNIFKPCLSSFPLTIWNFLKQVFPSTPTYPDLNI